MREVVLDESAKQALDIATLAARLKVTRSAGDALRRCLREPPQNGVVTLKFNHGTLYRIVKEESF